MSELKSRVSAARWRPPGFAVLGAAVPAIVYLATVAPTVYGLDSAELTTGAYVLGVVHAPGAPLFMLLGHLFTWLPVGDVGYRVNLLSVCAAAGAIGVLCSVLDRLLRDRWVAVGASWCLAFSFYYWISAVAAELYALHVFFIALLLWLGLSCQERPEPWRLALFGWVFGLGLGNHLTLGALAPGFAYLVLSDGRWRQPRVLATLLFPALCGASIYLYLPWRAAAATPLNYAAKAGVDVTTFRGFWWMVRGGMFESQFLAVPWWRVPQELARLVYWLWSNFLGIGCVIGLIGLAEERLLAKSTRRALILMFIGHVGFVLTYAVIDKDLMLTPAYVIWTIWIGLGAKPAMDLMGLWLQRPLRIEAGTLVLAVAALFLIVNYSRADVSGDWSARRRGEAILDALPPNALFVGSWADVPILEYLSLVEGRRLDVETANIFFFRNRRAVELTRQTLQQGRSVYSSLPNLFQSSELQLAYVAACDCYQILPDQP